MRLLDGILESVNMSFTKLRDILMEKETWYSTVHGVTKSQT